MTNRRSACLLLAACLLTSARGVAGAEERLIWTETASEGFVSLRYGSLDPAKSPLFLLSCFDAMGIAVLDVRQEIGDAKPGDALTIVLSAGATKAEAKGEAARDDASGSVFAEASDLAVNPVLEVLRQAGPVTVTVGTASASLSESGRAQVVEKFSKDCALE